MEEKELDLSKVNQIDMECNIDSDEDGFGGFAAEPTTVSFPHDNEEDPKPVDVANDDRELVRSTGIILDFGGDDDEIEFNRSLFLFVVLNPSSFESLLILEIFFFDDLNLFISSFNNLFWLLLNE